MDKGESDLATDGSSGHSSSLRFWAAAALLALLAVALVSGEDSIGPAVRSGFGVLVVLGHQAGGNDALVGLMIGIASAFLVLALGAAGFGIGYALLGRDYPNSRLADVIMIFLAIGAAGLYDRGALDWVLTGSSARIANTTQSTLMLLALGAFFVYSWRLRKDARSNQADIANPAGEWDPFDTDDEGQV